MNLRKITAALDGRRGHAFLPPDAELARVPKLYATDGAGPLDGKLIHLHYFIGSADWWVAELDPATGEAFGYACLGDPMGAEWGYVSLVELAGLEADVPVHARVRSADPAHPTHLAEIGRLASVVERDLDWTPTPFGQVSAAMATRWG